MPPKKKLKAATEKENKTSKDALWCLDCVDLTFKKFIEHFECLDRNRAQIRYGRVLKGYFNTKNERDTAIRTEYTNWLKSADYLCFWNTRLDSTILLKTGLGSSELISDLTDQRIESLQSAVASSSPKISDFQVSNSPNSSNPFGSIHSSKSKLIF